MPVTFFHTSNSYMVSWQEEGETSRAKDLSERSPWRQQPCPHSDPACRSPAEPPLAKSNWKPRAGEMGWGSLYRSAPRAESVVKGRECIWGVKGRQPESYVTIQPYWNGKLERWLSWSTLGLKEELNLGGKRSWSHFSHQRWHLWDHLWNPLSKEERHRMELANRQSS